MTLHAKLARHNRRSAFTLMEMLIVVAIIVALAGICALGAAGLVWLVQRL